jgi:hypothetical protein
LITIALFLRRLCRPNYRSRLAGRLLFVRSPKAA